MISDFNKNKFHILSEIQNETSRASENSILKPTYSKIKSFFNLSGSGILFSGIPEPPIQKRK